MTQTEAYDIMRSGSNVFLTGDAGTGKSWLTQKFISDMRKDGKTVIVVAPTGVAAINVGGATLHSVFRIFGIYPIKRNVRLQDVSWNQVDALVIDEISMVGPDILDQIDFILKSSARYHKPFGGIQTILVGDAGQLKPVYAPHTSQDKQDYQDILVKYNNNLTFDSAEAFIDGGFKKIHLTEAMRQKDPRFLQAINALRDGFTDVLDLFNQGLGDQDTVHLMSVNRDVDEYNHSKFQKLPGEPRKYPAEVIGDFNIRNSITPTELSLKVDARVMLTKNIKAYGLVNGDLGYVRHMSSEYIEVKFDRFDFAIPIEIEEWKQIEYIGSEEFVVGSFIQFPLKLSWAMTVHKSQGLTLDNVCVHVAKGMYKELLYVGVSRASNMEKLFINRR